MGIAGRSIPIGSWILLIATAIQGLTPDQRDLASIRLLRLVASGPVDCRSTDVGSSSPTPIRNGHDEDEPGAICATGLVVVTQCVRLDSGARSCIHFLSFGLVDRPIRSSVRPVHRDGGAAGSDGLTLSLCRLLC